MKLRPPSFAIALAIIVLPQPGGPKNKIPGGRWIINRSARSGSLM